MKRKMSWLLAGLLASLQLMVSAPRASATTAMIFCNGDLGTAAGLTASQINGFRASGLTTMVLFAMSVSTNGSFTYGGQTICSNGVYLGPSNWGSLLSQCLTPPSSVTRIEMCVGGWGDTSWTSIKNLIAANGTNSSTVLYQNLSALKNALGIAAIDSDDEGTYDSGSAISFGQMCGAVGLKLTLCPYTDSGYWAAVKAGLGSEVDYTYLQCYSGGAGNDPASWAGALGVPVSQITPGYWDSERNTTFLTNMLTWAAEGCTGGFLWPSCSGCTPPAGPSEMLQYAEWIDQAFYIFEPVVTPTTGFAGVAAYNLQTLPASTLFTLSNAGASTLSWSVINTSSWLNVSSSSGTLATGVTASVTVSLNPAVATNLAQSVYAASIVFSNQTVAVAVSRNFTLDTAIANWPVALAGFNAALLASNNATAGSPGATGFDIPNDYCLYQQGLSGGTQGLPLSGSFPSQCDSTTVFQLGSYGAADALILGDTYAASGTLALASPAAFNSLAILAASANGGGQGTFVLNFTNGTHSPVLAFNCQDWFYTVTNVAIQGFGRLQLSGWTFQNTGSSNPNLYETAVNLATLGLSQPISSITFSAPAGAGGSQSTAVFAISGLPASIPVQTPAGLTAMPGSNATVQLSWNPSAGATNYNVKQSVVSGSSYVQIAGVPGTSYTATGLGNGSTYYYVVSAVGAVNESTNSSQVSAMPGSYLSWALAANPVAYWPLNETSGTVAYDLVQGSNGVYAGAYILTAGGFAGAGFNNPHRIVIYNGSSGDTQIPRLIGSTNFSIVFWVRTSATGGSPNWYNGMGLVDGDVSGVANDFGVTLVGSKVGFGIGNPDTTLSSVKAINNGIWHQVAVTHDAGSGAMDIYIDGAFDSSLTGPTGAHTAPPDLTLGRIQSGGGYFLGSLSDVSMYQQALTPGQIATLYRAATGLFYNVTLTNQMNSGSLVLSWPGNGQLLAATNVSGPWITNGTASPTSVSPNQPQMFYRIQTQ
jgi:hypothetical protein